MVFAKVSQEVTKYRYLVNGEHLFDGPSFLMTIIELTYTNIKANITLQETNYQAYRSTWTLYPIAT